MKKFFQMFFYFSILSFGMAYFVDYMISTGLRKSKYREYQVWNDIYDSKIKSNVIILGNSRAWGQYDPRILDSITHFNFYNLGIDGHPINYQLIRFNTFLRFNPIPKYIIQNIDYATMAICRNSYEREQFFPYIQDDSLIDIVQNYKKLNFIDRYIPLLRYFGYSEIIKDGLFNYFGNQLTYNRTLYKGYSGNNENWNGSAFKKIISIKYDKDTTALRLFENYIANCNNNKIKLIFISAPLYFKATKKIKDLNGMNRMYLSLAKKYNLKILDYTKDPICYDTAYFYNAGHLNKKGAELFSTKLALDLKKIFSFDNIKK